MVVKQSCRGETGIRQRKTSSALWKSCPQTWTSLDPDLWVATHAEEWMNERTVQTVRVFYHFCSVYAACLQNRCCSVTNYIDVFVRLKIDFTWSLSISYQYWISCPLSPPSVLETDASLSCYLLSHSAKEAQMFPFQMSGLYVTVV